MCILVVASGLSRRFPLVIVHNRDEFLKRETLPPQLDAATGIYWARDASVANGGSWLGLNARTGAFAVMTNCRRAPTTLNSATGEPLLPAAAIVSRTQRGADGQFVFTPDASRGRLVADFLRDGALPDPSGGAVLDGYNLLTCNLADATRAPKGNASDDAGGSLLLTPRVLYTTNRYAAQRAEALATDERGVGVHAMANSFLDNPAEPKTQWLRDQIRVVVARADDSDSSSLLDFAAQLAEPMCARNGFAPELISDALAAASRPFSGWTAEQRLAAFGEAAEQHFVGRWSLSTERALHGNVFVELGGVYQTRTQSLLLVEDVAAAEGRRAVVHLLMRTTRSPVDHDPWTVFTAGDVLSKL